MNILSTTVEYKGNSIKVQNGRIFCIAFGTTIYNQNDMRYSWFEIKPKGELKDFLIKNKLIKS